MSDFSTVHEVVQEHGSHKVLVKTTKRYQYSRLYGNTAYYIAFGCATANFEDLAGKTSKYKLTAEIQKTHGFLSLVETAKQLCIEDGLHFMRLEKARDLLLRKNKSELVDLLMEVVKLQNSDSSESQIPEIIRFASKIHDLDPTPLESTAKEQMDNLRDETMKLSRRYSELLGTPISMVVSMDFHHEPLVAGYRY